MFSSALTLNHLLCLFLHLFLLPFVFCSLLHPSLFSETQCVKKKGESRNRPRAESTWASEYEDKFKEALWSGHTHTQTA